MCWHLIVGTATGIQVEVQLERVAHFAQVRRITVQGQIEAGIQIVFWITGRQILLRILRQLFDTYL